MKLIDIILEQDSTVEFPEMGNLGAQLSKAVKAELEKESTDEAAGAVGIIGVILLSNTVANMISKIAKYLAKKVGSQKMLKSAEWWEHFTHKNEEAFMHPIDRVVSLFIKDEAKREGITKLLYAILIFSMASSAGGEAVGLLKKSKWGDAAVNSAKALIKGIEVNNLITHAVSDLTS